MAIYGKPFDQLLEDLTHKRTKIWEKYAFMTVNENYGNFHKYGRPENPLQREKTSWYTSNSEYGDFQKKCTDNKNNEENSKSIINNLLANGEEEENHQSSPMRRNENWQVNNDSPTKDEDAENKAAAELYRNYDVLIGRQATGTKFPPIESRYIAAATRPPSVKKWPQPNVTEHHHNEVTERRHLRTGPAKRFMASECCRFWNNMSGIAEESGVPLWEKPHVLRVTHENDEFKDGDRNSSASSICSRSLPSKPNSGSAARNLPKSAEQKVTEHCSQ